MKIQLVSKVANSTSRGILDKAWYMIDGYTCMVKSNSITPTGKIGYEPYSEVMASDIAEVLGLHHVRYWLADASLFPEIKAYGIQHVSVCRSFNTFRDQVIKFEPFALQFFGGTPDPEDLLTVVRNHFNDNQLDKMFALDALIGNEDRHINNFDVISRRYDGWYLGPIYDCGASLLAWCSSEDLGGAYQMGRYDKAKPLRKSHRTQLNLVQKGCIPRQDLQTLYIKFIRAISDTLNLLPADRANAIKYYLKWRMKYLDKVMI